MIKLVASDLDGTIIDKAGSIYENNFKAINDLNQKNIDFVICTGKTYPIVKGMCSKFNASYGIFGNGNEIINLKTGEEIYKQLLTSEQISSCISIAKENHLHVHLYTDTEIITESLQYMDLRNYRLQQSKIYDSSLKITIVPDINQYLLFNKPQVCKLIISAEKDLSKIKDKILEKEDISVITIRKYGEYKDSIINKEYEYLDISPKNINKDTALNILKNVDLIAAEDTRQTLKLLNHFEISKPLISYHRHNEETKSDRLIEKLNNGENIALVSDAGTPGICDPGEEVIKKAIEEKIDVIPIPGACAFVNALIASGLDTKEFTFLGFLPLNKKLRKEKLDEINKSEKTIIIYEAPHKMKNTLTDLKNILNNRKIVLARELTKIHEEFIRSNIDELIENINNIKGELILIIEGATEKTEEENKLNNLTLEEHYKYYEKQGFDKKEIIKKIAKDRNVNKNEIYMKFI